MAADDARARLRRYLEQRRDLGESELVLDSLDVAEVMRLLGARGDHPAPEMPRDPEPPVRPDATRTAATPAARQRGEEEVLPGAGAPATAPPHGDWRASLRASGAAPEQIAPRPTPANRGSGHPPSSEPMPRSRPETPDVPAQGAHREAEGPPVPVEIGKLDSLAAIAEATRGCTRCPLYQTAKHAVPGEGSPDADLMVVGEAPGANEDETGRPFIGAAGQLLTKILAAVNLGRDDVFIANVIKHRPPGNRNPKPDEVLACSPYLVRQIELVRPKVILALGTFAAQTLLDTKLAIGKLRGAVHEYHGVPLIVTYHPAALLRNPAWKRPTWEDVQLARRVLDRASGA